jgi:hypothetical protein
VGGKKISTGILVTRTKDCERQPQIEAFFQQFVDFLNRHRYENDRARPIPLRDRVTSKPNFCTYKAAKNPDMSSDPKRKLGDVITLSDAISHLHKTNPSVFNRTVYQDHPGLIERYFNPPYPPDFHSFFGFPLESDKDNNSNVAYNDDSDLEDVALHSHGRKSKPNRRLIFDDDDDDE